MFRISQQQENGFAIVELTDDEGGCFAKITPEACASLHAFGVKDSERNVQVIDHYNTKEDFINQAAELGFKGLKLSPFVCRLKDGSYSFHDQKYQIEKLNDRGKHAIHGLLFHKKFSIIKTEATPESASVSMQYIYDHEDTGFPFSYECRVTYTLNKGNQLTVSTRCTNLSDISIPMQDGWHPYFNLGGKVDQLELEFPGENQYVFNEELVPNGEKVPYNTFNEALQLGDQHLDNSFILDKNVAHSVCKLKSTANKIEVLIQPSPSYPILQIYTPPHRKSIAVENLSGPPNDLNLKEYLTELAPGEHADYAVTYQINLI